MLAFAQTTSGDPIKALETMRKALALDPRNEQYRFNVANIYLSNRQPDKAAAVLESLRNASRPEIAARAAAALSNVRQYQEMESSSHKMTLVRGESDDTPTTASEPATKSSSTASPTTKWGAPAFVRGTVSTIDCSTELSALLTLTTGSRTLKLRVADKAHVILMGADQFSCSWTNKKVAVNYRQNDAGDTNVISLELQ